MTDIRAVGWDVDQVIHQDYTTSLLARLSGLDPTNSIDYLTETGILPNGYVKQWEVYNDKEVDTTGTAAEMLTDAYKKWEKKLEEEEVVEIVPPDETNGDQSVLSKEETIYSKQKILERISKQQAGEIAEMMDFTTGFEATSGEFEQEGLIQTAYSDGADWVVSYLVNNYPFDREENFFQAGGGVPPVFRQDGEKIEEPTSYEDIPKQAEMTGEVHDFDKAKAFFDFIEEQEIPYENLAVIDDSADNIEGLLKKVQEEGGLAVGFNPKEKELPDFKGYNIPVIDQDPGEENLKPFKEIVFDRSKVENYCI